MIKAYNDWAIKAIAISCVFFIAGKLVFFRLFAWFEPAIQDIHFQITERPGIIPASWLFAIMMAVVILLIKLIWQLGPVVSTIRRISVAVIIIGCMIVGILVRHQQVKNYFNGVVRPYLQAKHQLPYNYPIDPVNFVYYMFAGCCVGCIISFLIFRQKIHSRRQL